MADPTSGGLLGGLEGIMANPLTQAALSGYLNYIGTPRYMGRGGALANAGVGGLNAFNQAEQTKLAMPLQRAQTQQEQAKVGGTQAQTQLTQIQAQQAQRQITPPTPQLLQSIDAYMKSATDPQEKAWIGNIRAQYAAGAITAQDADTALEKFDEQKRLMEYYKGLQAQAGAQFMPQIASMFPGFAGGGGMAPPAGAPAMGAMPMPSAPTAPAATTPPAPDMGAASPDAFPPDIPFKPVGTPYSYNVPGVGDTEIYQNPADGKWYFKGTGGWQALPS